MVSSKLFLTLTALLLWLLPTLSQAGTLEVLHLGPAIGRNPHAGLVQGSDGDFYGTTYAGGNANYGTVFKITPAGVLTTLHSFNSYPHAGLVQGSDGDFYGTTGSNGTSGYGTVFKITPCRGANYAAQLQQHEWQHPLLPS
jgi:uncharacterized repeat protein (TIGR03803 family)